MVADKARPVWMLLAVGGLVVAVVAGVSALRGGDGGGDPRADRSAVNLAAESAAGSTSAASSTTPATDPTPTPQLTPATGWPDVELPETHPAVVVERFLAAVFAADCDRALRQVTASFEEREGDCALFARDMEGWEYAVGETEVAEDEPTVTVPATLTLAGQDERYAWELVIVEGAWRIDDVEQ